MCRLNSNNIATIRSFFLPSPLWKSSIADATDKRWNAQARLATIKYGSGGRERAQVRRISLIEGASDWLQRRSALIAVWRVKRPQACSLIMLQNDNKTQFSLCNSELMPEDLCQIWDSSPRFHCNCCNPVWWRTQRRFKMSHRWGQSWWLWSAGGPGASPTCETPSSLETNTREYHLRGQNMLKHCNLRSPWQHQHVHKLQLFLLDCIAGHPGCWFWSI